MKYKLHCFAQSGNAYKAALMLNLCSADWEAVFVDYFSGVTRSNEYQELNDMGEVPVLEAKNLMLSQSGVILDYLSDAFEMFDARSVPAHREVLRWLFFDNHKLTGSISTLRYLRNFTDQAEGELTRFLDKRARDALQVVERRLQKHAFLVGSEPTIADISMCGYLFWPDEIGINLADDYPAVAAWLDSIKDLPGWAHPYDLMPGHPLPGK